MKKTSLILSGAFSLAVLTAVLSAAQTPGEGVPGGTESGGMWQDEGPGAARGGGPWMEPGAHERRADEKGRPDRMDWSGMKPGGPELRNDQEVTDLIKKYDPVFAAKLAELKKTAPKNYSMLMRMSGKMAMVARFENDPEMEKDAVMVFSLEYGTKELARRYDKASDGDKDKIKKELGAKVSELFDVRLKVQGAKIQRMEKDLAKLRKNLESRRVNKARIVEERVGQLTGEGYGW